MAKKMSSTSGVLGREVRGWEEQARAGAGQQGMKTGGSQTGKGLEGKNMHSFTLAEFVVLE